MAIISEKYDHELTNFERIDFHVHSFSIRQFVVNYISLMSFFGENIKKIRSLKKLTQSEFSELFKLNRTTVGAYEEGRAEPKIDTIIEIANYFGISIDEILTKRLTINEILHFHHDLEIEKSKSETKSQIPLVTSNLITDYLTHFQIQDFIKKLPTLRIHNCNKTKYLAIEFDSSQIQFSESNFENGDILICSWTDLKTLNSNDITNQYFIVDKKLSLVSGGILWKENELIFNEIWKVEKMITNHIPQKNALEKRMEAIENKIDTLIKTAGF